MAGDKRARCETEDPEDVGPSNGSVEAKKPKTKNGKPGSSKRKRPPRNLVEEQELNKLDQKEYAKITENLSRPGTTLDLALLARRVFWKKFCKNHLSVSILNPLTFLDARGDVDTCPEDHTQMLNSRGRDTVAERRKSCPWFFWGLDGYVRQDFPEGWTYFFEDGEEDRDSLDSPLLFPWNQTQAASADSTGATRDMDKTGSFALPLNELEKAIEDNEKEMSKATSQRDRKRAESGVMRKKAAEFNRKADKLDGEVAQSDETLKQIQPLLGLQKLILAARKANESYGNQ